MRTLIAIPTYNEEKYVERVLDRVLGVHPEVLVIDDGSKDATPALLARFPVEVIRHAANRGYGRSLMDAFRWAAVDGFDWLITMDCDEQHEPAQIPEFLAAADADNADVISGSRYLEKAPADDAPPPDRRAINAEITAEINRRLGLRLTDSFCGFKAYRVSALRRLTLSEPGYAFPMQFWVQAVAHGLRISEIPVKLIYNDLNRTFGGPLNDADIRRAHYRRVLHCELRRCQESLPPEAVVDTRCRAV
ncbi:MAG: glycosyltransferase family 2 protein [Phycisphaerales bacterium]|nr:glycosyltransferase family 2 protein [Phycisphaerales bacterium]MCB9841277.1 glycosyltransferase family 2 protein [Phycisphaeraceae bacterium]